MYQARKTCGAVVTTATACHFSSAANCRSRPASPFVVNGSGAAHVLRTSFSQAGTWQEMCWPAAETDTRTGASPCAVDRLIPAATRSPHAGPRTNMAST